MNPNTHTPLPPAFFNPLERYSEAEWEQLAPDWRSELETQYVLNNPVLRDKVERGLNSYRQKQGYLPTEEELGLAEDA
jgi:hypothetical protein